MKKLIKQKIAYALALVLGFVSVLGGYSFRHLSLIPQHLKFWRAVLQLQNILQREAAGITLNMIVIMPDTEAVCS